MTDILKQAMTDLWASSGDIVAPDSAKIQEGWVVEVVPRQWWNWFENRQDTNIAYLLQKGIPEWDAVTEYLANKSYIQYSGTVYRSILTGTNKIPVSEPTYWRKAFPDSTAASEALASTTPAANTFPYFTNGTTASTTGLSAFARTILDDVDAAAVRTTISAQEADATLTAIAAVATSTNALIYFNGVDTATSTTLTAFGRSLIDDVDAAAGRTTLGVVIGTDIQAFSPELASLGANSTNGLWARTGAGTGAARTLTGTTNKITVTNGDGVAGNPTLTIPDAVTLVTPTVTGNLTFSGASQRIIGDFSNATVNSRLILQTSSVDLPTRVTALPNGTATTCTFEAYNASDASNAASARLTATASDVRIESQHPAGGYLPLGFYTGGVNQLQIQTNGNILIPGSGKRIQGDFSSPIGSLTNRVIFQSSTANGQTAVAAIPNGTSVVAGFQAYASTDMENSQRITLQCSSGSTALVADKTGAAAYPTLLIQAGGADRVVVNTDGRVDMKSTSGSYSGILRLQNSAATVRRELRVADSDNAFEIVNQALGSITHRFGNDGHFAASAGVSIGSGGAFGAGFLYSDVNWGMIIRARQASPSLAEFSFSNSAGTDLYYIGKTDQGNYALYPSVDNTRDLGLSSNRWRTVYAGTGTINTSDAREKTKVNSFSTDELNAAKQLAKEIGTYQWLTAIQEKGEEAARKHIGMTVQRAIQILEENSLNPFSYGFICYDQWEETVIEHPTEDGKEAWTEITPAGDRYSFRMDELLAFIAAGFEARLAALEAAI